MKKKKEKEITLRQIIGNNLYAVGMIWKLSPSFVIHSGLERATGVGIWVFFSAFFIRYIINAVETKKSFQEIFTYIMIVTVIMASIVLYATYARNVVFPTKGVEVYHKLYRELYAKAENMELSCYEDSEFYNRYTMALDRAEEKMMIIIQEVFGIFLYIAGGIVAFAAMYSIDRWMLVFAFAPLIGNFVFGTL
ncbi:MAG: ABC transporter ATP-binding protein, partial [Lachnoclostridium sp.]|nr:ABC transporter ATP-binding protein [Lachnoclostridium sp.]